MPQIKSRVFEAAFNKSIILCLKDPWNIIEMFFEPETEFIYFENEFDLVEKISYIKDNYNEFQPMIEKAYQKAVNNYTTQHFYEKYLKSIKF
jgi:spore maturation protein CgeB